LGTFQYGMISKAALAEGSLTDRLQKAYDILGPGTVIGILLVVVLITVLVMLIPYRRTKNAGMSDNKDNTVDNVIAQIVEEEERELTSDYELVAVITAAIQAYLGEAAPAGGFVVRSIRKVNSRRR